MKKLFVCFLFVNGSSIAYAQQQHFKMEDYFYYRNHLYLNTPSVLLNAAGLKAMAKDTAAAITYFKQATSTGLFDSSFISQNSRLNFVTKSMYWSAISKDISSNRLSFSQPENMQLSFDDINRFWKIYDRLDEPGADQLIMTEYILKGSAGLRTFFEKRMGLQPGNLLNHIRSKKKYFESIRDVSLNLHTYKPAIIAALKKLKVLYPAAYFPPTYFTIGSFNAFGTADGGAGQLIGAEFLVDRNTADTTELSRFEKSAIADTSKITGIIVHELIHSLQQTSPDESLLARSINEGAADFISELVLGYNINSKIHDYGDAHEKDLWQEFNAIKSKTETSGWLYNGISVTTQRPADLGYYVGFKICAAYYQKAPDKLQAISAILHIKNYQDFLIQSGYNPR